MVKSNHNLLLGKDQTVSAIGNRPIQLWPRRSMRKVSKITSMTLTFYIPKIVYADNYRIGGQLKGMFTNFSLQS
jgi:hypothetical protein